MKWDLEDQTAEANRAERDEHRAAARFDRTPSREEIERPTRAEADRDEWYLSGGRG